MDLLHYNYDDYKYNIWHDIKCKKFVVNGIIT